MSPKTDIIQALTDSVTKSLGEIVSLKETLKQNEDTITKLNNKNGELTLELTGCKSEAAELTEQVANLNKELHIHDELVKKLESENKALTAAVEKLEKGKSAKTKETAQN